MRRIPMTPRPDWRHKCDQVGFTFYDLPSEGGQPYWRESAAYAVSLPEVESLEKATKELFERCMDAVDFIVTHDRYDEFGIPEAFRPLIRQSWDRDDATVYGRFDLAWQADGPAKLLEFNADTPTSLIESSVVQWFWLKDVFGDSQDQFNSLHEQLIEQWRHIRQQRWQLAEGAPLHLASLRDNGNGVLIAEDFDNVAYMAETARAAGFIPRQLFIEDILWDDKRQRLTDGAGEPLQNVFKLYPWEWMVQETYSQHLLTSWPQTNWIEPIWKMLLSNKQLLVVLWELFPDHPHLLPAYNSPELLRGQACVRKPKLGREGANVQVHSADGKLKAAADGGYGDEGYVWQAYCRLPVFEGWNAVLGSWIIGDTPAGIDFRETSGLITGDMAFFVPHYIE